MKRANPRSNVWTKVQDSRRADTPDLWIKRKGVVGFVLGLSVYAFYVAVGRSFVPAVQRRAGSSYSRAAGIGLLTAFIILWLMFMWSYATIISRPPGYAKDVVAMSPAPWAEPRSKMGTPTDPAHGGTYDQERATIPEPVRPFTGPDQQYNNAGVSGPTGPMFSSSYSHAEPPLCQSALSHPCTPMNQASAQTPYVPRPVPVVTGEPRWCRHCKIVKPDRTHHCRHCGTCILQFDHHCMWIGQCVGWYNHSVFLTFNLWAGLFCLYTAIVLVVDVAMSSDVDGQKIAIICVSGFLAVFTAFMMFPTHLFLILKGRSTVESFQSSAQMRAENSALENAFQSKCMTLDMRRVRRQWEAEFGGVAVNDRWAFGRKRDMWRREMGTSWVRWILPIGRPQGDGIHFPANPRFGPNGEWLPMRDWPKVVAI